MPNTILGAVYGGIGHAVGEIGNVMGYWNAEPSIGFGNNALEFTGNPFGGNEKSGALTLGNTITWGPEKGSNFYNAFSAHERFHTNQGQFLGPLYLPANAVGMGASLATSPIPSMRRTVPGASKLFHGKLNIMEGPIFRDELY